MRPQRRSLDFEPGTVLGKFEILRKLAVGGMAEIYLARARGTAGFEKLVVLKRMLPHIAQDPAFVQMFLDEARLAASLQHPNIADVYDVGEVDGDVFFTMEYLHGQDVRGIRFAARKRNEPIPLDIALAIVRGVAAALDYAHECRGADGEPLGMVHRDVSSSNVMISYDGAIKLLDFGIARVANSGHKTQTGTLKGNIPYMSPEQCRGWKLDRRSDLFSLGNLMFELTVGRRAFRGESDFAVMDQIVHHDAPRPSQFVANYPPELERMVMKLLQRDPEERYQTAEALLHDLEAFLSEHRLWASSKPISKYMHQMFAARIAAWEKARKEGSLLQAAADNIPVAEVVEVVTPPRGYPVVEMPDRPSGRVPIARPPRPPTSTTAAGRPTPQPLVPSLEELAAQAEATIVLPTNPPVAEPVPTSQVDAEVFQPRRGRRLAIVGGGIAAGVLAIVVVLLVIDRGGSEAVAVVPNEPVKQPTPPPQPSPPKPAAEDKAPEPVTVPKPITYAIAIASLPAGAEVFVGTETKARGTTPYTLEVDSPAEVSIKLVRAGFVTKTRTLEPAADKQVELKLDAQPVVRRGPVTTIKKTGSNTTSHDDSDDTMNPFKK